MANSNAPPGPALLAGDFPSATEADWRKLVDTVLKGGSFEQLKSRTYDGLTIAPLYSSAREASVIAGRPGGTAWAVMQRVDHPDPVAANLQAREDLDGGATGLVLVFSGSVSANGFGLEANSAGLARALEGIDPRGIVLDLNLSPATRGMACEVATLIKHRGIAPSTIDLRLSLNPIGGFAAAGRSAQGWQELAPSLVATIDALVSDGFRGPFAVADGRVIHNAGGSEAQELAFALAGAVTYLRALEQSGMALQAAYDAIYFRLTADADQFLTTAKFRAIRKLWARVATAAGLSAKPAIVTAETAWRMLTRRDPYGNILRSTIAVAAAGLGGADAITVLPHTAALGLPDAFARRIARNMQLVLLEESNLARVADPTAGSGAFEALTGQLCLAAWTQFQVIERAGGVWPSLESGLLQQNVATVRAARAQALACGREILTGTNAYPDIAEAPPGVLDVAPRAPARGEGASVTAPSLPRLRLAEPFEALRDKSDRLLAATGARPKVFLAALGSPAEFAARANFAKNFFEAGGIEAVSGAISDYRAAQALIACLCASGKVSEHELESAAAALKRNGARHIYLTGRRVSAQEDMLRAAGVQTFIDDGSDALATLNAAYDILQQKDRRGIGGR